MVDNFDFDSFSTVHEDIAIVNGGESITWRDRKRRQLIL
jgi:hypothetical protein